MESKFAEIEFMLGYNPMWKEYEIIEHSIHRPVGEGTFCFQIGEDSISDGDGVLASYDDSYVRIDEKDFRYVKDLFYKTGEKMCALAEKHAQPIARSIVAGDYVYDGGYFIHIQKLSDNREKLWIERFFYDTYELDLNTDLEEVDRHDDYDVKEIESECLFISQEIYIQALKIAKSAILEITDYLRRLHTQIRLEKSSNQ